MIDWPDRYRHFPDLTSHRGTFHLRPLRWEDREPIRRWRNDQIDVLRQTRPLTGEDQDAYYRSVLAPQFDDPRPSQILWALDHSGVLVGYGGLVHFAWSDRRAEVSFLTDTSRVPTSLAEDWTVFLEMLVPLARNSLGLHKLTTETYSSRPVLVPILESRGFVLEGTLREHHQVDGMWVDSLAHGLLLR